MFTKKFLIGMLTLAVFTVFAAAIPVVFSNNLQLEIATTSAWAGGTDDGQGGCCDTGGDSGGRDTTPTPPTPPSTPDPDPDPDPVVCKYLKANGQTGTVNLASGANSVVLTWQTQNANQAFLDGVAVALNNTAGKTVGITGTQTFVLNVKGANGNDNCTVKVIPTVETVPVCNYLTASPNTLPHSGGNVVLKWETTNAAKVTIDQGIGTVAADNTSGKTVSVSNTITYTLTASNADGSNASTCKQTITVGDKPNGGLTCSEVSFSASNTRVNKGDTVTLNWSASSKVDNASIDNGIGNVSLSGSRNVTINNDITYRITISNANSSVSCPVTITTNSGGGGGGSSSPYCGFYISDKNISRGEKVTLRWNTSHVNKVTIVDNDGNVIINTTNRNDLDSNIDVRPTRDTEYTLTASRGSNEVKCRVEVRVGDDIFISQTRNQLPWVSGISLTQVPYTGFEAGPALTLLFYALLAIWALYVAYIFVIKRDSLGGVSFAGAHEHIPYTDVSVNQGGSLIPNDAESYVASSVSTTLPDNLPTATPVVGYGNMTNTTEDEVEGEFNGLENLAHSHKVLLSTDAMRYLVSSYGSDQSAEEVLTTVIEQAKSLFPSENGWVVLNLARMESLMGDLTAEEENTMATIATPSNAGSLAEAIVTGNIVAAYQMIGHRPMVSLAAAAADLDALNRVRKGEEATISSMLKKETATLSNEQITEAIHALTSAIDGVYTDEAEAVKMAILKAVKAVN